MGRMDKINQQMKREIGNIIQMELQDPRLQFVSVTHVEVSRDLRHARVSFSVFGDKELSSVLEGLNKASGLVRRLVGQRIRMRYTPEIEFVVDKSMEYSSKIEQTLKEIHDEDSKNS